MNSLRQQGEDYLALLRSRGFKLRGHDRLLMEFADYVQGEARQGTSVTSQLVLAWATRPTTVHAGRWKRRLGVARGFCAYLHALDPSVEVPAAYLLAGRYQRPTPYLYTDSELASLLTAANTLRPALRAVTYQTFIGVIAATGMRVGEAIHLDRTDVDLEAGRITIRDTKFNNYAEPAVMPSGELRALRAGFSGGTSSA